MPPKKSKIKEDDIINFYNIIPKSKEDNALNPGYKQHGMELNFRALICGPSGSMKSNTLLNLIRKFNGTFDQIIICIKNANEPLYNYLRNEIKEGLTFFEDGIIPSVDDFKNNQYPSLIVFDDLVMDKKAEPMINEWFKRGRKVNFSCIFISQSFFRTNKFVRENVDYILLKRLSGKRDLKTILSEYNLDTELNDLVKLYKFATSNPIDFFMIDIKNTDKSKSFRKNFKPINI